MRAEFVRGNAARERAGQRNAVFTWVALMCLAVGLILLDRGFARWRNDPRNFTQASGAYPTAADLTAEQRARMSDPTVYKLLAASGAGLLIVSTVLFGFFPFGRNEDAV